MHTQASAAESDISPLRAESSKSNLAGSSRNGLLCALAVVACVLIANPTANIPFIDGFSYAKTALVFAHTGNVAYNGWATAMLGWLIPWGAFFIKAFGFSFNVTRMSMLPIDVATVYLFYQILRRFGLNDGNAILGTLALALSPLFLPLAASFMTDVPGLFVIVICIYMCQRAVAAKTDRVALIWLCFAAPINVAGGTVRQIAWLGALIMVPSTAWLLRDRSGMRFAGIVLWIASLGGVLGFLHWFNRQPYSVPEHIIAGRIHAGLAIHLGIQLVKTLLCLLLVVIPVSATWLVTVPSLSRKSRVKIFGALTILVLFAMLHSIMGGAERWLVPWLTPIMLGQGTWPVWVKVALSISVIAPALVFAEHITAKNDIQSVSMQAKTAPAWREVKWILGPFSVCYLILLIPRGTFSIIQDRYLEGLAIIAIVVLLRLYQERVSEKLSLAGVVVLIGFALYSIGGTHDLFAESRALVRSIQMVENSGVPRDLIRAGMASDGWAQIELGGHINDPRIQIPAGAYNPHALKARIPSKCSFWFDSYAPTIAPEYSVDFPQEPCFAPTKFPPVTYTAWLPPFHRTIYVQKLKNLSR